MEEQKRSGIETLLWLDDRRDPYQGTWLEAFAPAFVDNIMGVIWVKSYAEFISWIDKNGLPTMIGFDHDLGGDIAVELVKNGLSKRKAREYKKQEKTGYDCAKWVVEYCMKHNFKFPNYTVQSANTVGTVNIISYIENYKKHWEK